MPTLHTGQTAITVQVSCHHSVHFNNTNLSWVCWLPACFLKDRPSRSIQHLCCNHCKVMAALCFSFCMFQLEGKGQAIQNKVAELEIIDISLTISHT